MKKVVLGIFISVTLILSMSSVALAGSDKKPIAPPELKEITFVHYAKPDVPPGKAKKDDPQLPEPVNDYYELLGLKLADNVSYQINPFGAPAGAIDEIIESFEAWDIVTSAELFTFGGQTSTYSMDYDEQNTVSWMKIASRGTIAMTRLWYNEATSEIVEFDMIFNSLLKWGIDPDDEEPDILKRAYDVENIATHEVGHIVGLDDLYEDQYRELTMYGYGKTGEVIKISLEEGDIAGAQYLHGSP